MTKFSSRLNTASAPTVEASNNAPHGGRPAEPARRMFGKTLAMSVISSLGAGALLAGCGRPDSQSAQPAPGSHPQMNVRSSLGQASAAGATTSQTSGPELLNIYNRVSKDMHGFVTGNADSASVVYSVIDPMCPHCANLWMQSRLLLERVKFVWLPVPLLGNNSLVNGALIIASANPADAMNVHEYKLLNQLPPLTPVPEVVEAGRPKMEHNGKISKEIKLDSVPFIMVKRASGEVVMTVGGIGAPEIVTLLGQAG